MLRGAKNTAYNWILNLLAKTLVLLLMPLFPPVLAIVHRRIQPNLQPEPAGLFWFLTLAWAVTLAFLSWYIYDSRKQRRLRIVGLTRSFHVFNHGGNSVVTYDLDRIIVPPIEKEVEYLLDKLRSILVHRLNPMCKGATVYINDIGGFALLAQSGHDDAPTPAIKRLRKDSLAGDAIRCGRLVTIPDCRHAPPSDPQCGKLHWDKTRDDSRFVSRTATPIRLVTKTSIRPVGVLCFDIDRRHVLSQEDQEILVLAADAIASLWLESQPHEYRNMES